MKRRDRVEWAGSGLAIAMLYASLFAGCQRAPTNAGKLEAVWGRQGLADGRFQKPRAMTIDSEDRLYIVDMSARIQVFTPDGQFLRGWQTPEHVRGRPTGLSIARDGRVLVADTHYYRVLIYSADGKLLKTMGGTRGPGPGEFGLVTDIVDDAEGNLYVAEYGQFDRIQKFNRDGKFLQQWGGHGSKPGQFVRPQKLAFDAEQHLWVTDACNHRIQVFDTSGKLLRCWGQQGGGLGQLKYPYDLALDGQGHVYVCEFGNHRVQKFTLDGKSLGAWGHSGRKSGELFNPWALAYDSRGRLHVLDTGNHRVQRIRM